MKAKRFSAADEATLKLAGSLLGLRLQRCILQRDSKKKAEDMIDAIKVLSVLCKQKTYKAMIRKAGDELQRFFGFSDCSLLFHSG